MRNIGALLVFGGAAATAAVVLSDRVRDVENYFGTGQLVVALIGLAAVVVGGALLYKADDASDEV